MQTAQVIPFKFEDREVRTLLVDDQPWFVAADVCESLAIVNTARALTRLDEDEKGIHSMNTPGGAQNVSTLNESGLYSLILTSRKAEAKRFKKWVTAEVLPAIRKTGRYESPKPATLTPAHSATFRTVSPSWPARLATPLPTSTARSRISFRSAATRTCQQSATLPCATT